MSGEIACGEVVRLSEAVGSVVRDVRELSLIVERVRTTTDAQTTQIVEHTEWLRKHQELMERMARSEQDREALHEAIDGIRTTARWAIGLGVSAAASLSIALLSHLLR